LKISFVQKGHRVAIRGHGNAGRAKPGQAVAIRMNGFLATASMASAKAIQALCQAAIFEKYITLQYLIRIMATGLDNPIRIQNLHPHICCATHNDWATRSKTRRSNIRGTEFGIGPALL
jgi:hypothetical protein